ncbi:hypothetical protein A9Q82_09905 [Cycloclasticus sp. 46_120_T64]|nr:hypothetical protein A9Q82_09905 [Cycloclasticus sp. 46_120_T64]
MPNDNAYSITQLFSTFSTSLITALAAGLSISYLSEGSLMSGVIITTVAVSCSQLASFFLILRPSSKSLTAIANALHNNEEIDDTEVKKIQQNPLLSQLYQALNKHLDEFKLLASNLGKSGNTIAIGSAEVSSFVDGLNQTIQNQADKATQISSAAEEISQSTGQIASMLSQAVDAAARTHAACTEGEGAIGAATNTISQVQQQVQETSTSINALKTKSEQIQSITDVIDGVAAQTNLLALNAAIEAARAGEHGRGFAVVADEVRELANKTASATSDIAKMLSEIRGETETAANIMGKLVGDVDEVVDKTNLIGQTLASINTEASASESQARDIQDMIQEHVLATAEISNSIEQVRGDLENTEKESVTASTQAMNLASISERIYNDLSAFNVGGTHDEVKNYAVAMGTEIQQLFETAIESQQLSESQLFDTNYQAISGTNPEKYSTQFDSFCDRNLPSIQEKYLQNRPGLMFAAVANKDGYIPTHNNAFAKAPTGNYQTDLIHSRSKRLFQDPVSIRGGNNTQAPLLQTYKRDTGEICHDMSVPLFINGRHWGAVRVGYHAET